MKRRKKELGTDDIDLYQRGNYDVLAKFLAAAKHSKLNYEKLESQAERPFPLYELRKCAKSSEVQRPKQHAEPGPNRLQ